MSNFIYGHGHILPLTGLRAVGAILVVFYHFHKIDAGFIQPLLEFGGFIGVMIFFALSGYILIDVYSKKFSARLSLSSYFDFMWKRIARVYPLHIFLLIIVLFLYPKFIDGTNSNPKQLLSNLTLTQAWSFDNFSFIAASWSISVEFLFYIFFPFIALLIGKRSSFAIFIILGLTYSLRETYWTFINATNFSDHTISILKITGHNIFRYGSFFIMGVCIWHISKSKIARSILDNNYSFIFITALICSSPFIFNNYKFAIAIFSIPLLVRATHTSKIAQTCLGNRLMVWVGELSYAIYLSHQLMRQLVLSTAKGQPISPLYEWGSTYILIMLWSIFCYYCIETPARSKIRSTPPIRT